MEQYFFKVGHTYTDKNKLYKELREWIQLQHGTLINGKDGLKAFKKMLKDKVGELCVKHNRCKPISIDYLEHYTNKPDSSVFVSSSWTAEFYKVRINYGECNSFLTTAEHQDSKQLISGYFVKYPDNTASIFLEDEWVSYPVKPHTLGKKW